MKRSRLPMLRPVPLFPRLVMTTALVGAAALWAGNALAEMRPTLTFSGSTGLIDMPSGEMQGDSTLSISSTHFGPVSRTALSYQITPRLSGTFRYIGVRDWNDVVASKFDTYYDRSFDVSYQLTFEDKYLPAISIGLMDVIGTGLQSAEYVAATKTFGNRLKVTAGLGWGRLGSYGAIGAPFGERPEIDFELGGKVRLGQWFKGDMAPFAGIEWQINDKLNFKAEYSSDAYELEAGTHQTFERKSPLNFGIEYRASERIQLGAYYVYGSEFGIGAKIAIDPRKSPMGGTLGDGPPLVKERPGASGWSTEWVSDQGSVAQTEEKLAKSLAAQGVTLERLALSGNAVELRVRVPKGGNAAQVIGRISRVLTGALPPSVEQFHIVPVVHGMPLSRVSLRRSDMEQLDFAPAQDRLMRDRVSIQAAQSGAPDGALMPGLYPKLDWGFSPYVKASLFDPDNPFRADFGLRLSGKYEISPGLFLSGSVSKRLLGNMDKADLTSSSDVEPVRSNANKYAKYGDPTIDHLTFAWYSKPSTNLYSRVTVGYLESMFGGVSGEVLWKPVDSRLAIGAELNYVKQREFDQLLGFQDYDVVTGHVSGYYTFDNGFIAQIDVGRYLAGDVGATFSLDREFANGWKVGAFATLTDMPFEDFGEGSFDKGIRVEIPFSWITGMNSEKTSKTVLRPLLRDGGARLEVDGRLYETVRRYDAIRLDDQWGKFWR